MEALLDMTSCTYMDVSYVSLYMLLLWYMVLFVISEMMKDNLQNTSYDIPCSVILCGIRATRKNNVSTSSNWIAGCVGYDVVLYYLYLMCRMLFHLINYSDGHSVVFELFLIVFLYKVKFQISNLWCNRRFFISINTMCECDEIENNTR